MKKKKQNVDSSKKATRRLEHEAEGGASGAIAGALMGAAAGPPGAIAGAIIGGVAGALAGAALDGDSSASDQRTRKLDAEIGVSGGTIGAPNLKHPPATTGAYSAASSGAGDGGEEEPAEGPMQTPES
jgi:hypothetical protein